MVNAFIEADRVELLQGNLTEHEVAAGSGNPHVLHRCRGCGVAVWSHYSRLGRLAYGVRAGTLDEPGSVTPDAVIFTESKMPWVALPESIPAFEQTYDYIAFLPADRSDRLKALAARRAAGEG